MPSVIMLRVVMLSFMVLLKVPSLATALSSFTYDYAVFFTAINKTLNICQSIFFNVYCWHHDTQHKGLIFDNKQKGHSA